MMVPWKAAVIQPYCWVVMCRLVITVGAATARVARDRKLTSAPSMIRPMVSQRSPTKRRIFPPVLPVRRAYSFDSIYRFGCPVDGQYGNGNANFQTRKDKSAIKTNKGACHG